MARIGERWLRLLPWEAAKATVGWVVTGLLSLAVLALSAYLPVVGNYMSRPVAFSVRLWILLSLGVLTLTAVGFAYARLARWKAKVTRLGDQVEALRSPRAATYRWEGLDWVLGPDFWSLYEHSSAVDLSDQLLDGAIWIPECPRCHEDAMVAIINGNRCRNCGQTFETYADGLIALAETEEHDLGHGPLYVGPLHQLKREVYTKAQAAARRGELRRPEPWYPRCRH
jgi:hypothetical protein